MPARTQQAPPQTETTPEEPSERDHAGESSPEEPRRRIARWLRRPAVFVPLLLLAGVLAGYGVGVVRLAARGRQWDARRGELEQSSAKLESALREAQSQEASYRVLVSVSRVVVDLYDRNFGLAAEELRRARGVLESVPGVSGSELATKLDTLQADLDDLSRRVEEMSRSARETVKEIEREVTALLFPEGS